MKLYKLSIFALALAGAFVSCDDDNDVKYVEAPQSPGCYFPVEGTMEIALKSGSSTAEIPVYRTVAGEAQTVSVTATFEDEDIFTYSPEVSFDASATVAYLKVSYDPEKIVADKKYVCNLTLPEDLVSQYGINTSEVVLILKAPVVAVGSTTGDYYYAQYFEGVDQKLKIDMTQPEGNDQITTYVVHDWFYGVDLNIAVHKDMVDPDGNYVCFIPETFTGYVHPSYGEVFVTDIYTYTGREDYKDYSFYDPNSGLFSLCVVYYCSAGVFGNGYEYLQLAGFPDYSVYITYQGLFTEASGERSYAVASVDVGADVQEAIVANVQGDDVETAVQQMLDGSLESQSLSSGMGQEVRFEVPGGGDYTMIAISMSDGNPQNLAFHTYTIQTSTPDSGNWESLGYLQFVDGWILPWFGVNPYEYTDYTYTEVQVNLDNEAQYRLHNPYNTDFYFEALGNEGSGRGDIVIDTTDPDMVVVMPQYSGFSMKTQLPWEQWYVAELAGFFLSQSYPAEEVKEYLSTQELNSTFQDGLITLMVPVVGTEDDCEYNPMDPETEENIVYEMPIDLKDLVQAAPARPSKQAVKLDMRGLTSIKAEGKHGNKRVKPVMLRTRGINPDKAAMQYQLTKLF